MQKKKKKEKNNKLRILNVKSTLPQMLKKRQLERDHLLKKIKLEAKLSLELQDQLQFCAIPFLLQMPWYVPNKSRDDEDGGVGKYEAPLRCFDDVSSNAR